MASASDPTIPAAKGRDDDDDDEDEELAALRLAALLSRKSNKSPNTTGTNTAETNYIQTQTCPVRKTWVNKRRAGANQKSSTRSNLIVITPVGSESSNEEKPASQVAFSQSTWCPASKTVKLPSKKQKGPSRFSRYESSSSSSSSSSDESDCNPPSDNYDNSDSKVFSVSSQENCVEVPKTNACETGASRSRRNVTTEYEACKQSADLLASSCSAEATEKADSVHHNGTGLLPVILNEERGCEKKLGDKCCEQVEVGTLPSEHCFDDVKNEKTDIAYINPNKFSTLDECSSTSANVNVSCNHLVSSVPTLCTSSDSVCVNSVTVINLSDDQTLKKAKESGVLSPDSSLDLGGEKNESSLNMSSLPKESFCKLQANSLHSRRLTASSDEFCCSNVHPYDDKVKSKPALSDNDLRFALKRKSGKQKENHCLNAGLSFSPSYDALDHQRMIKVCTSSSSRSRSSSSSSRSSTSSSSRSSNIRIRTVSSVVKAVRGKEVRDTHEAFHAVDSLSSTTHHGQSRSYFKDSHCDLRYPLSKGKRSTSVKQEKESHSARTVSSDKNDCLLSGKKNRLPVHMRLGVSPKVHVQVSPSSWSSDPSEENDESEVVSASGFSCHSSSDEGPSRSGKRRKRRSVKYSAYSDESLRKYRKEW